MDGLEGLQRSIVLIGEDALRVSYTITRAGDERGTRNSWFRLVGCSWANRIGWKQYGAGMESVVEYADAEKSRVRAYHAWVEGDARVCSVLSVPDACLSALVSGDDQLTVGRERDVVDDRGEVLERGQSLGGPAVVEVYLLREGIQAEGGELKLARPGLHLRATVSSP